MSMDELILDLSDAVSEHQNTGECVYLSGKSIAMLLLQHRENFSKVIVHGIKNGCLDVASCDESQLDYKAKALASLLLAYLCRDVVKITAKPSSPSEN